jgi:uncharacterized lipoprotein YbaY
VRQFLCISLILPLLACAGGQKPPAVPPPEAPTATAVPSPAAAPSAPISAGQLTGGWGRTIRSGVAGREGFLLDADGRFALVGIFSMDGVAWTLEGDTLILSTSTERYPDEQESRLHIDELTPTHLILSGKDYLAGSWQRSDLKNVTGTVTYRQRIALTPEAVVQVELRDVSRQDAEAPLLARRLIRKPGQVPVAFTLDYDPSLIEKGHAYAVSARISDRGQLQFVTDTRVPVLTSTAPTPVEIAVVPVR